MQVSKRGNDAPACCLAMSLLLIGKKIGMTQIFAENGDCVPVTVVEAGPCPVVQVKTLDSDGYNAVQIGFREQKPQRLDNGIIGHCKKAGVAPMAEFREFRTDGIPECKKGDVFKVDNFTVGQLIDVIGCVKGRGFQGVVKRHDMDGQPDTHGHMTHRRVGSIGMRQFPGHVFKGKRMPGHMGTNRVTVQNLVVVKIMPEKNLLLIRGSLPGANSP